MKSRILQWLGVVLVAEMGVLHLITAPHEYEEAAYLGVLFVANFLGALVVAFGIYRNRIWGWALGAVIALGSIAGYVWSRTLGMPGALVEEWFDPFGIVALSIEGLFLVLVLFRPWRSTTGSDRLGLRPASLRYLMPAFGLIAVAGLSLAAYRWDAAVGEEEHGHLASVSQICGAPPMSFAELEQQYGIRVTLVAISAMDSIVDIRLKVIDPNKAKPLLAKQGGLLVDEKALIPAPHMHGHGRVKPGGIFFMFFPTKDNLVRTGSQVSLVFGSVRIEPTLVQ